MRFDLPEYSLRPGDITTEATFRNEVSYLFEILAFNIASILIAPFAGFCVYIRGFCAYTSPGVTLGEHMRKMLEHVIVSSEASSNPVS